MRQILQRHELRHDPWRYPGEAGSGPQVMTVAELLATVPLSPAAGVHVGPNDDVLQLAGVIDKVLLIVVHFEKNGDGRGFSQAQVLRQQLKFTGELRAAGVLKRDHLYLLARCGFDAFDLDPAEDRAAALAQLQRFSVAYQRSSGTLTQPRLRAQA